ncbi:transcription factor TFIIIB component B'' homolog [Malaya genurostris]|uniref:transcription factor TFIIIB component B'' homolog n=1 Tax=Malaya genurostris TaxID=325434 RepID=UPI0026F3F477|nr:transcription factor TFIIIB component B'' homolog [Malaya genurostris]XP_058445682.1 transcription factor TFIIIB component B'' homolog [Malaya genurostris]
MAMRRPRVKVAANLSIRRPSKPVFGESFKDIKTTNAEQVGSTKSESATDLTEQNSKNEISENNEFGEKRTIEKNVPAKAVGKSEITTSPAEDKHTFKFPKPVEEPLRITTPAPHSSVETSDEPYSPKKFDTKFAYINALNSPRKRIRTESMTSNKSYSDVSLKSRKVIKQEESQKASDAKRDLRRRLNNIQNIDKQSLTMFDMIYYNPAKNPMKNPAFAKKCSMENIPGAIDRERRSVSKSRSPTPAQMLPPPPPTPVPDPPKAPVQLTPQLKLGPNGEMILDETSLVIENEREKEIRDTMAKTEIVYDDEFSGNSGYYSRYKRTRDWPPEETIRFYRCLHTIGTDFSMMIQLFPNRSRRDLKLKFKKEERLNLMLVNKALLYPKEFNIEELKQQFQQEDEEIERQRELEREMRLKAEETLKQQKTAKRLQLNQNKNRNPKKRISKAARVLLDDENLSKVEPPIKEAKPNRRKRKTHKETNNPPSNLQPSLQIDLNDAPYIPNGEFSVPLQDCSRISVAPFCSDVSASPSATQAITSPLDIESMDIEIVDEEASSVFEIKAEPQAYPVRIHPHIESESSLPNVITLQNLDDQSQTTVAYQEPKVDNVNKYEIDSADAKYYGGCDMVYLSVPANAPIAHPVKVECLSQNSSNIRSPTLQYEQCPMSRPDASSVDKSGISDSNQSTVGTPTPTEPVESVKMAETGNVNQEDLQNSKIVPKKEQEPSDDQQQRHEESDEQDETHGLDPLEDIDLNSLVLVESQDTTLERTIYEIYVIDPRTGKLSDKPLDVPEDVIENIRSILEAGENAE